MQSSMVMTTLEGHVEPDRWADLRLAFRDGANETEPGLVSTFLVQATADPTIWRIVTLWLNAEALSAMRAAGPPRGPLMFRAAGAEPSLLIANVVDRIDPA